MGSQRNYFGLDNQDERRNVTYPAFLLVLLLVLDIGIFEVL